MPVASEKKYAECLILDNAEKPYLLSELAKLVPGKPTYETVLDWVIRGRRHPDRDDRIKLEKINTPSGYASSIEAYWRWIRKFNEA